MLIERFEAWAEAPETEARRFSRFFIAFVVACVGLTVLAWAILSLPWPYGLVVLLSLIGAWVYWAVRP